MRVALLSDLEARGGAAIAATRLAHGLERAGHEVWRLVFDAGLPLAPRVLVVRPRAIARRLCGLPGVRRVVRAPVTRRALRAALSDVRPDVVNVHNLHGAAPEGWSVDLVAECARHAPTVWTLHDMWSFTGRCAYAGPCTAYLRGCTAACPTPSEYPALEPARIEGAWRARRDVLATSDRLAAVSPSRWLASAASEGLWRPRRVEVIPNGLALDAFRPIERATARAALGLPPAGRVVLVTAADLTDPRKGADLVRDALRRLRAGPLTVLLLGGGRLQLEAADARVVPLGSATSPALQSIAYSAADLLVHAAREDNLPNTILESLACGTPVVAFRVGGVPEAVRPGVTGWLADAPSGAALAGALERALADTARDDLRASCRAVAEAEYGESLQATRYARLFEELLGRG